jgi:cell wall assembly regulator SMI1
MTIDDSARALVQAIRRGEPAATGHWRFQSGTNAVWRSNPWGTPTRRAPISREWNEAVRELHRAVDIGNGRIEVELDLMPDRYRLQVAVPPRDRLTSQQIIDEEYRFPNHTRPGLPRPAAADPTDRPTDPDTLARVTGLVDEFRTRYRALRDEEPELAPGATEAEIAAVEATIGLRLPEDLRALYLVADGVWQSSGLLGFWHLWEVAALPEEYHEGRPGSYVWFDDLLDTNYVVFDAGPSGHVRRVSGNDWWVTIASDDNGNHLAVDLDPDVDGGYGQVLEFDRDGYAPILTDRSIMSRLERSVASLRETESWTGDDATWPPYVRDFDLPRNPHEATIYLDGRRLADALGDLETPSQVQCLRIFATDGITAATAAVDLGELSPLPLLRQVDVVRPASVTGRLPDSVEALEVLEGDVDLAAVAGHPSLWSLTVDHGVRVDTARLADLPRLVRLRIGAVDGDVTQVANLPGLRVLIAPPAVWQQLREHDALPLGLAAVGSAHVSRPYVSGDDMTVAEEVAWSTWIADHYPEVQPTRLIDIEGRYAE